MNHPDFNDLLQLTFDKIAGVLQSKSDEYASGSDKLHNFKKAAHLQDETPIEALSGMLAKHTVSIYDMMGSGKTYSLEQWDEKIIDHLNYLILLRALVAEQND